MRPTRRIACTALLLGAALTSGGCTLVKPVVGAVTGPIYAIGHTGELPVDCGCHDGCGAVAFLAVSAAAGAIGGLVTGVISDIQWLNGVAQDPVRNWYDPFATNTSDSSL